MQEGKAFDMQEGKAFDMQEGKAFDMQEGKTFDILEAMLAEQAVLEVKMGYDFEEMSPAETTAYIKEYALHMEHEMHEMLQELPYFKPWKKYSYYAHDTQFSFDCARTEWADVLHHFLNITIALGMDANMLLESYEKKNSINHLRQQDKDNYKPCVGG